MRTTCQPGLRPRSDRSADGAPQPGERTDRRRQSGGLPWRRVAPGRCGGGRRLCSRAKTPDASSLQKGLGPIKRSLALLSRVTRNKREARAWLNSPHPDLGEKTPLEVMLSGHAGCGRHTCWRTQSPDFLPEGRCRAAHLRALRRVLPTLPRILLRGPWYRAVHYDHLIGPPPGSPAASAVQPLWPGGAARKGARFTPRMVTAGAQGPGAPGIDCVYLAEDELTPLLEIAGVLRAAGSRTPLLFEPQVMMTVDGVLSDVLDLTDVSTQHALGTTHQELTGSWLVQQSSYLAGQGQPPPTQVLDRRRSAPGASSDLGTLPRRTRRASASWCLPLDSDPISTRSRYSTSQPVNSSSRCRE